MSPQRSTTSGFSADMILSIGSLCSPYLHPWKSATTTILTLPVILSLSIVYLVHTILFEKPKTNVMIIDRINRTSRGFFKKRMLIYDIVKMFNYTVPYKSNPISESIELLILHVFDSPSSRGEHDPPRWNHPCAFYRKQYDARP